MKNVTLGLPITRVNVRSHLHGTNDIPLCHFMLSNLPTENPIVKGIYLTMHSMIALDGPSGFCSLVSVKKVLTPDDFGCADKATKTRELGI